MSHPAVPDFYAHLCGHHGYADPEAFAAAARALNVGADDPEAGTGRSTRAMLEAIAEAGAARPIVVVAPGGDHVRALALADRIADLQIKLGIIAPPIETTEDPDGREDAVLYIDHGKA